MLYEVITGIVIAAFCRVSARRRSQPEPGHPNLYINTSSDSIRHLEHDRPALGTDSTFGQESQVDGNLAPLYLDHPAAHLKLHANWGWFEVLHRKSPGDKPSYRLTAFLRLGLV